MRAWCLGLGVVATLSSGGCDAVYGLSGRDAAVVDTATDAIDATHEQCPADYAPIANAPAGSSYRIVEMENDRWLLGFVDCRNDTTTGVTHLVVFDDVIELEAIKRALPPPPSKGAAWVSWAGYARPPHSDPLLFSTVTGGDISSTDPLWGLSEPNNGNGNGAKEETVVWIGNNISGLIDAPYDKVVNGYVCECDGIPTALIDIDPEP